MILMYLSIGTTKETFGLAAGIYMFLDFFIGGTLEIFGISLNPQGFAILALPFMLFETNSNIKCQNDCPSGYEKSTDSHRTDHHVRVLRTEDASGETHRK